MPRGKLHTRDTNNRCKACGEPFPCPAIINARDISHHQVVPTTAVHARDLERQLRPMLEALMRFEHELSNYTDQDRRERVRHDSIAMAVKHLQGTLDALKQASQE